MSNIIVTTVENVPGREIESILGIVKGNTIRARHIGSDIGAGLKGIVGGEIRGYVKAFNASRDEAYGRMLEEAEHLGADAVVAMRFTTSQVMGGAAEIMAYGTAVKLK